MGESAMATTPPTWTSSPDGAWIKGDGARDGNRHQRADPRNQPPRRGEIRTRRGRKRTLTGPGLRGGQGPRGVEAERGRSRRGP